jgi:hypothetical protein
MDQKNPAETAAFAGASALSSVDIPFPPARMSGRINNELIVNP